MKGPKHGLGRLDSDILSAFLAAYVTRKREIISRAAGTLRLGGDQNIRAVNLRQNRSGLLLLALQSPFKIQPLRPLEGDSPLSRTRWAWNPRCDPTNLIPLWLMENLSL
jgi:hypothetical protein